MYYLFHSTDHETAKNTKNTKRPSFEASAYMQQKGFNNQLMKLLTVCPRKARYVDELLANSTGDFAYIMQREENLIQAMEAVATASTNPHQTDTFDLYI